MAKSLLKPLREHAFGLKFEPAPGDLHRHGSNAPISGFADALLMLAESTVVGGAGQPSCGADLTPISELSPSEKLFDEEPRRSLPDSSKLSEREDLLDESGC